MAKTNKKRPFQNNNKPEDGPVDSDNKKVTYEKGKPVKVNDGVAYEAFKSQRLRTSPPDTLITRISNEDIVRTIEQHNMVALIKSEEAYIDIVKTVVNLSGENLENLRMDKKKLRDKFVNFFIVILSAQMFVLFTIFLLKGFFSWFEVGEKALTVYMTSVFVETLSVIAIMITFAFKSKEEIDIIGILNAVVSKFKKYGDRDGYKHTEEK